MDTQNLSNTSRSITDNSKNISQDNSKYDQKVGNSKTNRDISIREIKQGYLEKIDQTKIPDSDIKLRGASLPPIPTKPKVNSLPPIPTKSKVNSTQSDTDKPIKDTEKKSFISKLRNFISKNISKKRLALLCIPIIAALTIGLVALEMAAPLFVVAAGIALLSLAVTVIAQGISAGYDKYKEKKLEKEKNTQGLDDKKDIQDLENKKDVQTQIQKLSNWQKIKNKLKLILPATIGSATLGVGIAIAAGTAGATFGLSILAIAVVISGICLTKFVVEKLDQKDAKQKMLDENAKAQENATADATTNNEVTNKSITDKISESNKNVDDIDITTDKTNRTVQDPSYLLKLGKKEI